MTPAHRIHRVARKDVVMIQIVLTLCLLFFAPAPEASAGSRETSGTWTASRKDDGSERLQFQLDTDGNGNIGTNFERSDFTGLSAAEVGSASRVPVRFELRREAGTITFEGTFRAGRGTGEYSFVPNLEFGKQLHRLDLDFPDEPGDEASELFHLAMFDVSTEFVRSMRDIGYRVSLDKYVSFRIFRVDPAYVRAMDAVGFRKLSADKLVETRIHGATPEYIRDMRAHGDDLTLDEYIQSRIFRVTPEFAEEMREAGYRDLDHDQLVQFKIHGVTPEFVKSLRKFGYTNVSADDLVAMRIHGVTPEFIRRVEAAGYKHVPIEKLVQMRIFDIDPEMVGALDDRKR
jgi:hypothetical protein